MDHLHFYAAALITCLSSITNIIIVALFSGPSTRREVKRHYILYASALSLWSLCVFLFSSVRDRSLSYFFLQILHLGAIFIPVYWFHFNCVFFKLKGRFIAAELAVYYLGSIFFLTINFFFSHYFIQDVAPKRAFPYFMVPGPLYIYWILLFMVITASAHIRMFKIYRVSKGLEKKQLNLFFVSSFIGYLGAAGYFLPVYDYFYFPYPYGCYGAAVFAISAAIAIVKYHLLDITIIIRRSLVFAGLFLMVMAVVGAISTFTQLVISRDLAVPSTVSMALSVGIAILLYDPTRRFLIHLTDHFLFQKKVDYGKLLKEASQQMAAIKSLKKLARIVVAFIVRKGRIKNASTFVFSLTENAFVLQASRPLVHDENYSMFYEDHPLIGELKKHQTTLEIEILKNLAENHRDSPEKDRLLKCLEVLQVLNAEVAIPSFLYPETNSSGPLLRSILFLGPKKSDEPYSAGDLDVFYTLAQESAIAVENARLYDEAIQKTRENTELKLQLVRKQTLANLASSVAHEIKGPVQRASFAIYFIKKALPKLENLSDDSLDYESRKNRIREISEHISKYLTGIEESNSRQLTTGTTIARFSRMERTNFGEMKAEDIREDDFEKHKIDVYIELNLIAENAKIEYQGRSDYMVEIDTSSLVHDLPPVKMNQDMLEQVVINLLLNAYDAVKGSQTKKIFIDANIDPDDKEFMHIQIKDTGSGIPDEIKEKVWEPDFTTKKEKGTGMGLYLCKILVEKIHQGRIGFEVTAGAGTSFHLKIPLWTEELSSTEIGSDPETPETKHE